MRAGGINMLSGALRGITKGVVGREGRYDNVWCGFIVNGCDGRPSWSWGMVCVCVQSRFPVCCLLLVGWMTPVGRCSQAMEVER